MMNPVSTTLGMTRQGISQPHALDICVTGRMPRAISGFVCRSTPLFPPLQRGDERGVPLQNIRVCCSPAREASTCVHSYSARIRVFDTDAVFRRHKSPFKCYWSGPRSCFSDILEDNASTHSRRAPLPMDSRRFNTGSIRSTKCPGTTVGGQTVQACKRSVAGAKCLNEQ